MLLTYICVCEVLRRGDGTAKENLGCIHVFIVGEKKSMWEPWERQCQATQECCWGGDGWPREAWGAGFNLGVFSSPRELPQLQGTVQLNTASSFSSALLWEWAEGGSAAQALPAPVLQGEKRNPYLQHHHPLLALGWIGKNKSAPPHSPWGFSCCLAPFFPPPIHRVHPPSLNASSLK